MTARALVILASAIGIAACGGLPILADPDPTGCHGVTCAGVCCPATFVCMANGKCEAGDAPPMGWGEGARARDAGARR